MMLQNLGLICQAMGLGGFPNFAEHEFSWFEALSFRMGAMPASKYLGANIFTREVMRLLGRNQAIRYALGLERDGDILLQPYCPPYYPSMKAAVRAVVEAKFGAQGLFRGGGAQRLARPGGDCQGRTGNQFRRGRRDHCLLRIHSRSLRSLSRIHAAFSHGARLSSLPSRQRVLRALLPGRGALRKRTRAHGQVARRSARTIAPFIFSRCIASASIPRRRLRPSAVRPYDTIVYCKNIWRSRWSRYQMQ